MKTKLGVVLTVALLFVQINILEAQSFKLKAYKMSVKGTSSLHDWESTVEKLDVKGFYSLDKATLTDVKDVVLRIPVTSIKSTKGKTMDNKTYEAFHHDKFPNVIFTLNAKKINSSNSTMDVKGTLAMAGTTNQIDMKVHYKVLPNGELQITGSKKLLMTAFKMEPPTAVMGTIKVGNEVEVVFDITLTSNDTIL